MINPKTLAFKSLRDVNFYGEWDPDNPAGFDSAELRSIHMRKLRMKFINELVFLTSLSLTDSFKEYWHGREGYKKTGVNLAIINGEYADDHQFVIKLSGDLINIFNSTDL